MANDCLVTKLKSVVDNDNLLPLGTLVLNINRNSQSDGFGNAISYNPPYHDIYIEGNGNFVKRDGTVIGKTVNLREGTQNIELSAGTYKVFIPEKYDLFRFGVGEFTTREMKFEDIRYCKDILYFNANGFIHDSIDFKDLLFTELKEINCRYAFKGSLNDVSNMFPHIISADLRGTHNVSGDVRVFAKQTLNLFLTSLTDDHSGINYGNLEDFVAAIRTDGKTAGNIERILIFNGTFKFNNKFVSTGDGYGRVEWTATHIVLKDSGGNIIDEVDA